MSNPTKPSKPDNKKNQKYISKEKVKNAKTTSSSNSKSNAKSYTKSNAKTKLNTSEDDPWKFSLDSILTSKALGPPKTKFVNMEDGKLIEDGKIHHKEKSKNKANSMPTKIDESKRTSDRSNLSDRDNINKEKECLKEKITRILNYQNLKSTTTKSKNKVWKTSNSKSKKESHLYCNTKDKKEKSKSEKNHFALLSHSKTGLPMTVSTSSESLPSTDTDSEPENGDDHEDSSLDSEFLFEVTREDSDFKNSSQLLQPIQSKIRPVVVVLGGPGSGKTKICYLIKAKYGFTHLSTGDLLRQEVASGSEKGKHLNELMASGKLVSNDQVLDLLQSAIQQGQAMFRSWGMGTNGFLVDGYPRLLDEAIEFEKKVCPSVILYFNCSDAEMTKRLLNRGLTSGRADDNEETIKKRLDTFHSHTQPILDHFKAKLENIDSERPVDQVFADVEKVLQKLVAK